MKRPMERENLFPHFRPCLISLRTYNTYGLTPPAAEEVVRDLVSSLPLICECAKEERCVNASVDGIVAVNVCGDIECVCNIRHAVEAADMIMG